MTNVISCEDPVVWDDYVLNNNGHPMQLWGWGEVKSAHGWKADRVFVYEDDVIVGAAQLLIRRLPTPFHSLVYVPRGPVTDVDHRTAVLRTLSDYARQVHNPVAISVEPSWKEPIELDGWKRTNNTILLAQTLVLDLAKPEDELQSAMSKKTRQYIRKSADGVEVRRVVNREELAKCLAIYRLTAERAGFALHDDDYYYDIYDKLGDHSPVMAAFVGGEPVAFLWLAISHATAFELYGGVNDQGQDLRANYILKWQTIQMMKKWGVAEYDLNGLLNDGISTFKRGFASHEDELTGTYDFALSPLYFVWDKGLPLAKKIIRTIKKR